MAFVNTLWGANTVGFEKNKLSVEQILKEAKLNYTVKVEPVYLSDGTKVPKCNASVREDTRTILGTVGDRYKVLQNDEAMCWFNPFIENDIAYIDNVGTLKKGAILFIQAKVNVDPVEITKGDTVESYINLLNSHTGISSVMAGFFNRRLFCENQLPALKASKHLKVKHTKNVQISLKKIQEIMDVANQEFKATTEQYKFLASKGVNKETLRKYITLVLQKEEAEEVELRESRIEKIECLYETGRGASNTPDSMWKAFNSINEYLNYDAGRSVDTRLQSLWMGANATLNQKALQIATDMATGLI